MTEIVPGAVGTQDMRLAVSVPWVAPGRWPPTGRAAVLRHGYRHLGPDPSTLPSPASTLPS
jgi:hypothetical protein